MATSTADILGDHRIKGSLNILNPKNPMNKSSSQVDNMVEYLVQKFGSAETHLPFYRKASWMLPDDTIRRLVAAASEKKANNPRGYFVACVKHEKAYYGN
jgi:hypothetical protein